MAQFPALDIWTDAWLADTAHLLRVDRDIYFHLMILMWRTPNCRVPNDMEWIARKLRCTQDEMSILNAVASEFCESDGNWLTQKRLTKEYKLAQKRSQKARDKAKLRWEKEKDPSRGNANTPVRSNAITDTITDTILPPNPFSDWGALEIKLRKAAGWENNPSPNLAVVGPIVSLIEAGCDWHLDVLPTITARAQSCRGVKTWKYFISAIQQARDDRLGALSPPNPTANNGKTHARNTSKPNSIAANLAVVDGAIEIERRRIEGLEREIEQAGEGQVVGGPGIKLVS